MKNRSHNPVARLLRSLAALLLAVAVPAQTYALQFSAQPTAVVAPATFSTTITVINTLTGLPEAPVPTFSITLTSQGFGKILGTTTLAATTATTTFSGLGYDGLEQVALVASAPGVTTGISAPIGFDRVRPVVVFPPSIPVNFQFDLTVTFQSMLNPPLGVSVTNLPLTLKQTGGAGRLYNGGSFVANGGSHVIQRVAYDTWDSVQLEVATPWAGAKATVPTSVSLETAQANLFVPPSTAQNVSMTVRGGTGAPQRVTRTFLWAIFNGPTLVQSGSVPVTNASTFTVPVPGLPAGTHQMLVAPAFGLCNAVTIGIQSVTDYPGPVLTLRPARVGTAYADTVSGVVTGVPTAYSLGSGSLPDGLALDPVTGAITGTPITAGTKRFQVVGQIGAVYRPMRVTLSVFSANETEVAPGQNFGFPGATPPYTFAIEDTVVTPGSTFDNGNPTFQIRTHYPTQIATITQPMPLLVLHHGRGFDHTEYNDVLGRVARWGFVCVSSGDYYSFFGSAEPGYTGVQPYETGFAEGGMESAAGTQERLLRRMIIRNRTPGDLFFGKIDESKLFLAGHSRGGGAVHAAQTRGFNFKLLASAPQIPVTETVGLAGYIGLMPFDLWYFATCQQPNVPAVPGGIGAVAYTIPKNLRRIPGLIFASELDGDLIYPICDQMIERRSTSTCFLTIWGGNHNNTGDAHPFSDAATSITPIQQRNILVQWMTAFLLRFGYDRLDLEGHLFGSEHVQSSSVGRVAYRDVSAPITVLDAQNGNVALNSLGLPNAASAGITAALVDPYPLLGSFGNATSRALRLVFTTIGAGKTWTTTVSSVGLNVQEKKRLVFELRQSGTTGFSWVSIRAHLTDINGGTAMVQVYDRVPTPDVSAYLPIHPVPGHTSARPLNRFLQVEVPLAQFPGVDLTQLASIRLEFDNSVTASNLLIDDLRIE